MKEAEEKAMELYPLCEDEWNEYSDYNIAVRNRQVAFVEGYKFASRTITIDRIKSILDDYCDFKMRTVSECDFSNIAKDIIVELNQNK
jgi:hypothetical protein